jgi:2-keto-4-pentenoate hydratase/2-oxohepta-3-ene-1,7-dioic acid hydratase in catechol pathway
MRLVTYSHAGRERAGLLFKDVVLDLAEAAGQCGVFADVSSVLAIVQSGEAGLEALMRIASRQAELSSACGPLGRTTLMAPIPHPLRNVFCVGRNYIDHVREGYQMRRAELKLPEVPQFFTKATRAVNAPHGDIRLDKRVTDSLDYEVELAVVIGKGGRDVPQEKALEHVFGYCVANDVTARDLQQRHDQWFKGKSLDGSLPLGPAIVTKEEIADVSSLELSLTVNGELRQHARVAQMIFSIPAIIASLSAGLTLEAGDIIATGTPSGVGYAMHPPRFLRDGDIVVATIANIGELRNRVTEVPGS